jgi:hypothetical protein
MSRMKRKETARSKREVAGGHDTSSSPLLARSAASEGMWVEGNYEVDSATSDDGADVWRRGDSLTPETSPLGLEGRARLVLALEGHRDMAVSISYSCSAPLGPPHGGAAGRIVGPSSLGRSGLCRWARHEWNAERRRLPTAGRRRGTVVARRRVVVARRGVLRCPLRRWRGAAPIVVVAVVVVTMIVIVANILIPVRPPARVVVLTGAPVVGRDETGFGLRGACGQSDARRTGE